MPITIVSPISAEISSSIPVSHKPKNTAVVDNRTVAITVKRPSHQRIA